MADERAGRPATPGRDGGEAARPGAGGPAGSPPAGTRRGEASSPAPPDGPGEARPDLVLVAPPGEAGTRPARRPAGRRPVRWPGWRAGRWQREARPGPGAPRPGSAGSAPGAPGVPAGSVPPVVAGTGPGEAPPPAGDPGAAAARESDPAPLGWFLLTLVYLFTAVYTARPDPDAGLFGADPAGGPRMAAWLLVLPYAAAGVYTGLTGAGRSWIYPVTFTFWPLAVERAALYLYGMAGQWMLAGFPEGWREALPLAGALAFTRDTLAPYATVAYLALAPGSLALALAVHGLIRLAARRWHAARRGRPARRGAPSAATGPEVHE